MLIIKLNNKHGGVGWGVIISQDRNFINNFKTSSEIRNIGIEKNKCLFKEKKNELYFMSDNILLRQQYTVI